MTTEETLCNIARNNALIFTEEEQDAIAEAILALQELEWYRKQNLIRREDVIDMVGNEEYCDVCIRNKTIYHIDIDCQLNPMCIESEMKAIKQIPKAEPNAIGGCETRKK